MVCSNCLNVEKRKSGDKLELLLDGESLLDAAHLVMKSMIMRRRRSMVKNIMMIKMNTEQHDEEDYIGYDDAGWRSLASCPGGERTSACRCTRSGSS